MKAKTSLRGLTLMEALLFLGLAAVVIIGAFTLYTNASNSSKLNQARTELQSYVGGIKTLYSARNDYTGLNSRLVIDAAIAPQSAVRGFGLINPWGGATTITLPTGANPRVFIITYAELSEEACIAMASQSFLNDGSINQVTINSTSFTAEITPAQAAAECNAGAVNSLAWQVR